MEIKPCPFCGKMPKIDTSKWKHYEHQFEPVEVVEQRVKIDCDECFLHMDICSTAFTCVGESEKVCKAVAKRCVENVLKNVWNRRANDC